MVPPSSSDNPAKCAGCHRRLKRPSASGYGPVCWRRLNGKPARITSPAAEVGEGQTALELYEFQPTLWSV